MPRYYHYTPGLLAVLVILTGCGSRITPMQPTFTATQAPTATPLSYPPPVAIPTVISPLGGYPTGYILPPPTLTPWPTITPGPSPTFPPTQTPWPTETATALPTIVPPIQTVTADHLPTVEHDLLFLNEGRLMHWDHITSHIETLVGPETTGEQSMVGVITKFMISDNGQIVALEQMTDSSGSAYQIQLLDLNTRRAMSLYQGISSGLGVLGMAFSPDGEWFAFIPQDVLPVEPTATPFPTLTPFPQTPLALGAHNYGLGHLARPALGGGPRSGMIYAVRTDAPEQLIVVGYCGEVRSLEFSWGCGGRGRLLWSSDSRTLTWNDARGIWLIEPGQEAQLLVANSSENFSNRAYSGWAWSASGRYLLTWINYYEGSSQAVIDTQTRQVIDVPDTAEYPELVARLTWMQDERLFLIRRVTGPGLDNYSLSGEVWRIDSANPGLLVRDEAFPIPVSPGDLPFFTTPVQLEDGRLAFAVVNFSNSNYHTRGLYTFASGDTEPHKVNGLPPLVRDYYGVDVTWSPNGSGAIFTDSTAQTLLYAPADGAALYDLRSVIGEFACCFAWVN